MMFSQLVRCLHHTSSFPQNLNVRSPYVCTLTERATSKVSKVLHIFLRNEVVRRIKRGGFSSVTDIAKCPDKKQSFSIHFRFLFLTPRNTQRHTAHPVTTYDPRSVSLQ